MTAPPLPDIFNRKRPATPPISMITFFNLLSLFFCLVFCQRSTEPLSNNNGLDTTSHNFTWEIDTIGTRSSSLSDVAIIDKNNIWAVGEIYTEEQKPYNAVHWNGKEWKLKRLFSDKVISPVRGIWAISDNNMWLAAGSIYHWDGNKANLSYLRDIGTNELVQKLWYINENDIYGVGTEGIIVHYNGQTWQRLDSGTDIDIQDIWGGKNQETGEDEILAIASLRNYGRGLALLMIDGERVIHLDTTGLHVNQSSIWFSPNNKYYISGNGVFKKEKISDSSEWFKLTGHPDTYKYSIRGNTYNDIFIVGSFGLVSHYNGSSWKHYSNIEWPSFYGAWYKCSVTPDIVVAVGTLAGLNGLILRGYRN